MFVSPRSLLRMELFSGLSLGVLCFGVLCVAPLWVASAAVHAQEEPAASPGADEVKPIDRILQTQEKIGGQFVDFERKLLQLIELTAKTDPRRAEVLRQAFTEGKERDVNTQFGQLASALRQSRLATAVNGSQDVQVDLKVLLELLMRENRDKNRDAEQDRIREYIKRLNKIIKNEQELQDRMARGGNTGQGANQQGKIADETKNLGDDIGKNGDGKEGKQGEGKEGEGKQGEGKEGEGKEGEGKQGEGKEGEGKQGEGKEGEGKQGEGKEGEGKQGEGKEGEGKQGEGKEGEGKQGEGKEGEGKQGEGKEGEGKQGEGQQGEGQQGEGQQGEGEQGEGEQEQGEQGEQDNVQKRIQAAQQKMKDAQQKLEKAEREGAVEDQEEAIRELELAKRELEEILRQLREEEIERMLAQLEARFKAMLEMQLLVYEGTLRLDNIPEDQRDRNDEIEAGRLSRKESQIVIEADKALTLLREEGTAVAMHEAVLQAREDMAQVVLRLSQAKVAVITQGLEEDIIQALEEMIAAVQKAQQDMEQKQQQGKPQQGQPQEPPLIDDLAELKMLRSLQMRVNRRTDRYGNLIGEGDEVGQATEVDLVEALEQLSRREQRIFQATRDIVTGRNK